jgi:hypothetical protein
MQGLRGIVPKVEQPCAYCSCRLHLQSHAWTSNIHLLSLDDPQARDDPKTAKPVT